MENASVCVKSTIILIVMLSFLKIGFCINFVDDLKDTILNAEDIFGDTVHQIGKMASNFKNIKNAWEDTVEEDCVYSCPNGKKPSPKKFYTPQSNGCGVTGMEIRADQLPIKDMTKCCDTHDICYGTCGTSKDLCDLEFKQCLYNICNSQGGALAEPLRCKTTAKVLYTGTVILGCKFFKDAQRHACYCSEDKSKKYKGRDEF